MKTRVAGFLVIVFASVVTGSVQGGTWQPVGGVWSGSFLDQDHWNGGMSADGWGNSISSSGSGTGGVTVSVPNGGVVTRSSLELIGVAESPVVLDARGSSFLEGEQTAEGATWKGNAFCLKFNGDHPLAQFPHAYDDERWNKMAMFELTDASVKVWSPEAGVAEMLVENGTAGRFNSYNPGGTIIKASNGARPTALIGSAPYFKRESSEFNTVRLRFSGGVNSDLPSVQVDNQLPKAEFVYNGGTHTMNGNVKLLADTTIQLESAASLSSASGEFSPNSCLVEMDDASRFSVSNLKPSENGEVSFAGGTFVATDLTMTSGSTVKLIDTKYAEDGRIYLKGSGGNLILSNLTGAVTTGFRLGVDEGSSNTVVFTGSGDTVFTVKASEHGQVGYAKNSYAELNIEGGTFEFKPQSDAGQRFNLGPWEYTGVGVLNVKGGVFRSKETVDGRSAYGLGITWGSGFVNVSGGVVDVSHLTFCTESNPNAGESVVRQTGGIIKVAYEGNGDTRPSANWAAAGVMVTGNGKTNRKGRIALDGGVLEACSVLAGSSAKKLGGSGWAAFEADGGRIVVTHDTNYLVQDFDEAVLGDLGLTVDTCWGYSARIPQDFTSKQGEEGRLILMGVGPKTIDGKSAVKIEAVEGRVVFGGASDNAAVDLVATNGVALEFEAGGSRNLSFKSIVLGDAQRPTKLCLSNEQSLDVDGEVEIVSLMLSLSGSFTVGEEYVVMTCGAVSESSKLACSSAVVTGLGEGQAADLIWKSEDGRQKLVANVRQQVAINVSVPQNLTSNVAEAVSYASTDALNVLTESGATLNFIEYVGRGAFTKDGPGRVYLNCTDDIFSSIVINGGLLSLPLALTYAGWENTAVTLGSATLELGGSGEGVADFLSPICILTPAESDAAVLNCRGDVSMLAPSVVRGCFVKRGEGSLTFTSSGTCAFSSDAGKDVKNQTPSSVAFAFDAFGTPPAQNYSSLTVAEGDLVLKGDTENSKYTVTGKGAIYVGVPAQNISRPARLIVDGVSAEFLGAHFHLGSSVQAANCGCPEPAFIVTNGAAVQVTSLQVAWNAAQTGKRRIRLSGKNTSLSVTEYVYLAVSSLSQFEDDPILFANDGAALILPANDQSHGLHVYNNSVSVFDNAMMGGANGEGALIRVGAKGGKMIFRNGARCIVSGINGSSDADATLEMVFDNAEWSFGSAKQVAVVQPEHIAVNVMNEGLILAPAADQTMTFALAVGGPGGLLKRGEGKLVVSVAPTFEGECKVESGVLAFADGAVPDGIKFSGAGTVESSTVKNAFVCLDLGDDCSPKSTLLFKDVSFDGVTKIVMPASLAIQQPKGVVVANFVGKTPDVSRWRLAKNGSGMSGTFTVRDGKVLMDVEKHGLAISVR